MHPENIVLIALGLTGLICFIGGLILWRFPPKKINPTFGYRTKRSKSSQSAWDWSQKESAKQLIISGLLMCLAAWPISQLGFNETESGVVVSVFILLLLIGSFLLTEWKLRRQFPLKK